MCGASEEDQRQQEDQNGRSKVSEEERGGNEIRKVIRTCIVWDFWAVIRTSAFNLSKMGMVVGYDGRVRVTWSNFPLIK